MASVSSSAVWPSVWTNCSQLYIDYWFDGPSSVYGTILQPSCLEDVRTVPYHLCYNDVVMYGCHVIGVMTKGSKPSMDECISMW
jgi:hypothetical protein